MSARDILNNIITNEHLSAYPFRYCLVSPTKLPYKLDGTLAKPNTNEDFVGLDELKAFQDLDKYQGIGISVIASDITAIDIDDCFKIAFDITTADERAKDIMSIFDKKAYIEFSFSGHGLRILFKSLPVEDYVKNYYIKNSTNNCEFYHPKNSARYVTLTGRTIQDNALDIMKDNSTLMVFLNRYMKRKIIHITSDKDDSYKDPRSIEELLRLVKNHYLVDFPFQNLWFNKAEGSKNGESDHDWYLLNYLFNHITKDKEKLRLVFEASPRFKSKDSKHVYKWTYQNYRYYQFMWERL